MATIQRHPTELDPGPFQNTSLIQLQASLDDAGSGLSSGCYDEQAARDIARDALDQLGLANWTITVDETRRPDGESLCAYFVIDPAMEHVGLIGIETTTPRANPYEPYAAALAEQLEATCLDLDEAASLARSLAAETVIESERRWAGRSHAPRTEQLITDPSLAHPPRSQVLPTAGSGCIIELRLEPSLNARQRRL